MLKELKKVRQIPGESKRRWFSSHRFDLIVWYQPEERISGFQMCYYDGHKEKALTWRQDTGYTHNTIDAGEESPEHANRTPILVPDGTVKTEYLQDLFGQESCELDADIVNCVMTRLRDCPESLR